MISFVSWPILWSPASSDTRITKRESECHKSNQERIFELTNSYVLEKDHVRLSLLIYNEPSQPSFTSTPSMVFQSRQHCPTSSSHIETLSRSLRQILSSSWTASSLLREWRCQDSYHNIELILTAPLLTQPFESVHYRFVSLRESNFRDVNPLLRTALIYRSRLTLPLSRAPALSEERFLRSVTPSTSTLNFVFVVNLFKHLFFLL